MVRTPKVSSRIFGRSKQGGRPAEVYFAVAVCVPQSLFLKDLELGLTIYVSSARQLGSRTKDANPAPVCNRDSPETASHGSLDAWASVQSQVLHHPIRLAQKYVGSIPLLVVGQGNGVLARSGLFQTQDRSIFPLEAAYMSPEVGISMASALL